MPTIHHEGGFRCFFFSNERNEPPHIHVAQAERYAEFWLEPVTLASEKGFRSGEVTRLHQIINERRLEFLSRWNEHFSRQIRTTGQ